MTHEVELETTIELELTVRGNAVPYTPASGPTYSCGGQPAEGGYCEDIQVILTEHKVKDGKLTRVETDIADSLPKDILKKLSNELYEKAKQDEQDARDARWEDRDED